MIAMTKCVIANPYSMPVYDAAKKIHGEKLPPVWCMHMGAIKSVIINAPEYLEDVYVKLNSMHTKHVEEHHVFNILMKFNIFTKFTETRITLSAEEFSQRFLQKQCRKDDKFDKKCHKEVG